MSILELVDYVERRSRLAGSSLIEKRNPFNIDISALESRAALRGGHLINFASYDYLGLSRRSEVVNAACEAVRQVGAGVNGSRLVGGERTLHRTFEQEIAGFVGNDDALLTVSGYGLNVSLIAHLLGSQDLLIVDELAHNSLMTGRQLSRATAMTLRHNDYDHLEYLLSRHRHEHKRILVVVEGLYSMDGDIPDLPRLIDIKRRYGAWLMVDEAHSIGVLGENGRGLAEYHGCDPVDIEFVVGTLSKALGSCGGFVVAHEQVIHWLRHTLPGFVYSVGATPAAVAASLAALSILKAEPGLVKELASRSAYALSGALRRGLNPGRSRGFGILPVHMPGRDFAVEVAMRLLEKDIYVPPIMQQAVSHEEPRLRMFLSADTSIKDIDRTLDEITAALKQTTAGRSAHPANIVPLRSKSAGGHG